MATSLPSGAISSWRGLRVFHSRPGTRHPGQLTQRWFFYSTATEMTFFLLRASIVLGAYWMLPHSYRFNTSCHGVLFNLDRQLWSWPGCSMEYCCPPSCYNGTSVISAWSWTWRGWFLSLWSAYGPRWFWGSCRACCWCASSRGSSSRLGLYFPWLCVRFGPRLPFVSTVSGSMLVFFGLFPCWFQYGSAGASICLGVSSNPVAEAKWRGSLGWG